MGKRLSTVFVGVIGLAPGVAAQERPGASLDSLLSAPVSSAAKYQQTLAEAAGAVTIVTADDIAAFGYRRLEQVLATVRGLYLSYDRNYTYVGARGFSRPTDYNNRILLLIDGHLANEGIWGTAPLGGESGIDLAAVERIEVVRGPISSLYGTGGVFGVINVVTRTSTGPNLVGAQGEVGSHGLRRGSSSASHTFAGGARIFVLGFWEDRDGTDLAYPEFAGPASDGIAHDLDWERRRGVHAGARLGGWTLHGRASWRQKGIPTAAYEMAFDAPKPWTQDDYAFAELKYEGQPSPALGLAVRGYFDRYRYGGDYVYPDGLVTEGAANDLLGAEVLGRWDVRPGNRLTVGVEARRHLTARYFVPRGGTLESGVDHPFGVYSVFAQDELQLAPRVTLLAGLRHDWYTTTGGATTPRVALLFDVRRGTSVQLLYGEAFRAPNLYEAEYDGDTHRRNAALGPEHMYTLEMVWQQRLGTGLLGTLSLYEYEMRHLIDLVADPETGVSEYRNAEPVRARGMEIGLDARLGDRMRGYGSWAWQRARLEDTGERLTNSPAHQARAGVSAAIGARLRPALELRYESGRRTVYDTWTRDFLVTDLHLLVAPLVRVARRTGELSARVDNLFGVRYATPGGFEHRQAAITQDGRTVSVQLGLRF